MPLPSHINLGISLCTNGEPFNPLFGHLDLPAKRIHKQLQDADCGQHYASQVVIPQSIFLVVLSKLGLSSPHGG